MLSKLFKSKITKVLLVSFLLVPFITSVFALTRNKEDNGFLGLNSYNDDKVTIDTKQLKDTYIAAGTVEVNADIKGDLIITAGDISISEGVVIEGNLIIAGGNIELGDVKILQNLIVAGGTIVLGEEDATIFVEQDVFVAGNEIDLNGDFNDDVRVAGYSLNVYEDTIIEDQLLASVTLSNIDENANIINLFLANEEEGGKFNFGSAYVIRKIYSVIVGFIRLLGGIILAWLVFRLLPIKSDNIIGYIGNSKKIFNNFVFGGILLFLSPIIFIGLVLSIIGIPLLAFFIPLFVVVLYLAKILVYTAVGKSIYKLITNNDVAAPTRSYAIVATIFFILGVIPIINVFVGLAKIVFVIVGFGAIIRYKKHLFYFAENPPKGKSRKVAKK